MNINRMDFTPKDVEGGELTKFLNMLIALDCENYYNDIHIWSDGYCTIVEWVQVNYESNEQFKFVDCNHQVVRNEHE
jgi:hypothetical protein